MEKNGNTFAPGDPILVPAAPGEKTASPLQGEVLDVDTDKGLVRVKLGSATRWWPVDQVSKP